VPADFPAKSHNVIDARPCAMASFFPSAEKAVASTGGVSPLKRFASTSSGSSSPVPMIGLPSCAPARAARAAKNTALIHAVQTWHELVVDITNLLDRRLGHLPAVATTWAID
jgi:hypothetical protein